MVAAPPGRAPLSLFLERNIMKALRFHAAKDLRLDAVPAPSSPGPGQVLVRVLQCGICGSDLHEYTDGPQLIPIEPHPFTGATAPQILGHEFSARVEAVGPGVRRLKVGDRVSAVPHLNVPGEYFSRRNLGHVSSETALVGFSWEWGGMGELALLPEENCVPLPDSVDDTQGALVEPASVALNAVDLAELRAGSAVLVTGAGPIGALVALCALASGATSVVLAEPNAFRRELLAGLPGITVCDGGPDALADLVATLTDDGRGFDAPFECAGHERALDSCVETVKPTGAVIQVGLFVSAPRVNVFRISEKALRYQGSWGFPITIGQRVVALIEACRWSGS
ncbi:zinc-binding dehydrogenase [Amaricoccus solimangrovi]|uniref:Zinc-binding dehydrogenase n=2 Tax=Amaricoccus solimangrovi TaxID=2589815 RepID=A0A501WC92_9RHOB|nr:zinc-binding dehydrogenase [Amaricoccus solimangrovi]